MDDLTFVRLGVTTFHEIAHFKRRTLSDTPKEILISDLSKQQNEQYYRANWDTFPFEIDAEYTGVMTMWDQLERLFPKYADQLMLSHLTERATKTKYMIDVPENGFQSKEQVEFLFENSYDKSLNNKRDLPSCFLRLDDEITKLLTTGYGILNSNYEPFYRQLVMSETGEELDLKMASLVSYLYPELQRHYSKLNFEDIQPETVFGVKMPETREEIRDRIGTSKQELLSFSKSVEYLTGSENDVTDDFSKAVDYLTKFNEQQIENGML